MGKKKLLFYSDSDIFGGHEIMTATIANTLGQSQEYIVYFMFFHNRISGMLDSNIHRIKLAFRTKTPLPFFRNFNIWHIRSVAKTIVDIHPELIIISQGSIEYGIKGLLAAKLSGLKTVSYIPLAYSFQEVGAQLAWVRDAVDRIYYRLPDAYITVNDYQKELLMRFARKNTIYTITNPVDSAMSIGAGDTKRLPYTMKQGLDIAVIGRIVFQQKNQNILVKVARLLKGKKRNFVFHIIGEGKDKNKLERLIMANALEEHFVLHGWLEKNHLRKAIKEQIDMVVLVSHFETGLPLSILEALAMHKPFLISDLDIIKEYSLPDAWVIAHDDPEDIKNKIIAMIDNFEKEKYENIRDAILKKHSQERFVRDTRETFDKLRQL